MRLLLVVVGVVKVNADQFACARGTKRKVELFVLLILNASIGNETSSMVLKLGSTQKLFKSGVRSDKLSRALVRSDKCYLKRLLFF